MNVMIDLETLGKNPGCVIRQIAAVAFNDSGVAQDSFNVFIDLEDPEVLKKLRIDGSTLNWWLRQDKKAIKQVFHTSSGISINDALVQFSNWVLDLRDAYEELKFWGNGATFDISILEGAYEILGLREIYPIEYNEARDLRTWVDVGRMFLGIDPKNALKFEGTPHNALDDCHHQIKYWKHITNCMSDVVGD